MRRSLAAIAGLALVLFAVGGSMTRNVKWCLVTRARDAAPMI